VKEFTQRIFSRFSTRRQIIFAVARRDGAARRSRHGTLALHRGLRARPLITIQDCPKDLLAALRQAERAANRLRRPLALLL
jgi:hypothetical protein